MQLQRLEDPPSLPQKKSLPQRDKEGENDVHCPGVVVSPHFSFDAIGPYEPLILSSSEEMNIAQVPASINCRLLKHQREGVRFLYTLYKNNHGGILGDDMGLGKTIQTIAFLAAVLGKDAGDGDVMTRFVPAKKRGPILIICPTSVIHNWENEFSEWGSFNVSLYHGPNRDIMLEKAQASGTEILITSFDTFRIHGDVLTNVEWDVAIVDEAHRLKNEKSHLYRTCLHIKTLRRIGLTGTIMQNKIMELFNLFDWVSPGSLGTREHFREFYDEPLKHGQRLSAPTRFVHIADRRKQHLAEVLQKYLLRRTKEETIGHLMMGKEDNIVFCTMSDLQKRAYKRMLELPEIQCLINKDLPCSCGSPLTQAECCHRVVPRGIIWSYLHRGNPNGCDSCPFCLVLPCLVKLQQISNHLELIKPNPKDDITKQRRDAEFASAVLGSDVDLVGGNTHSESFMGLTTVEHCGKMRALDKLLSSWVSQGDKILLFSYSVRMLDILEKFLIRKGYCFSRLDGSTPMNSRQCLVDEFNSSPSKQVFLISTRAGGLGLNLVSANRVVIFDPNWNPAQDLQAQDRSFRYGQKRHVLVFRLLAAGSVEELVYTRQVYKQQLSNIAVSGKMEKRYFEGVQDCKEYQGELFGVCNLFRDLSDKLFTSEIIELHGKHNDSSKEYENPENGTETNGKYISAGHPEEEEEEAMSEENYAKITQNNATATGLFEEMGIVYTHRNEDVINTKSSGFVEEAKDEVVNLKHFEAVRGKMPEIREMAKKEGSVWAMKKCEYSLLAVHAGMKELEFSRWLLSAPLSERKKMLEDYNRQKKANRIL